MRNWGMFHREEDPTERVSMLGSEICPEGLKEVGLKWPEAGKAEE